MNDIYICEYKKSAKFILDILSLLLTFEIYFTVKTKFKPITNLLHLYQIFLTDKFKVHSNKKKYNCQ